MSWELTVFMCLSGHLIHHQCVSQALGIEPTEKLVFIGSRGIITFKPSFYSNILPFHIKKFHERTHSELIKNSFTPWLFQPNLKVLVRMFSSFPWEMLKFVFGRNTEVRTRSPEQQEAKPSARRSWRSRGLRGVLFKLSRV